MGKLFKVALALFLIGVGVFAIFTAISEEPIWGTIDDEDYVYNELLYDADEFTGFNFDFYNRDFFVVATEDDQIKVEYYTSEKDTVTVTDSGDTLTLKNEVEWIFQLFGGWRTILNDDIIYDVTIYVPDSMVYDIDFNTSNGSFYMSDIQNVGDLDFDTSNGVIILENCENTSINLDTSNGRISLTNCITDSIDVSTSNGTIELEEVTTSGLIKLRTSNGKILLTDLEAGVINAKSSNQRITAINIKCTDVTLDTSNGSISLSIYGDKDDFEVYMDTSNGDMTYDGIEVSQEHFNNGGDYTIDLDTSNGDIVLTFIEE
jgi:DUF4097 and DUF4098 domain-containing protein YvlB